MSSYFTNPIVRVLARTPITPNYLTLFNLILASGAAALIITANLLAAGFMVLVAGFFDMLDGALARYTNRITLFGAILDSTIDRLAEGLVLLGILYFYAYEGSTSGILLTGSVLLTSLLVSYIKSRAEAVGIECTVGLFTRPERIIVLAIGLLINQLDIALYIIGIFSLFTVGQRLVYVRLQIKRNNWRK
ncbi:MAG: CDP-alcohol phosphatidyltransferase family protein [Dehalococcoidia bacterium]|nr:MAG: CDP-alcohol phosphatidyltransferase family protein [Dehalococcoidia bacterium]